MRLSSVVSMSLGNVLRPKKIASGLVLNPDAFVAVFSKIIWNNWTKINWKTTAQSAHAKLFGSYLDDLKKLVSTGSSEERASISIPGQHRAYVSIVIRNTQLSDLINARVVAASNFSPTLHALVVTKSLKSMKPYMRLRRKDSRQENQYVKISCLSLKTLKFKNRPWSNLVSMIGHQRRSSLMRWDSKKKRSLTMVCLTSSFLMGRMGVHRWT